MHTHKIYIYILTGGDLNEKNEKNERKVIFSKK